jgi:hypothetical protein
VGTGLKTELTGEKISATVVKIQETTKKTDMIGGKMFVTAGKMSEMSVMMVAAGISGKMYATNGRMSGIDVKMQETVMRMFATAGKINQTGWKTAGTEDINQYPFLKK